MRVEQLAAALTQIVKQGGGDFEVMFSEDGTKIDFDDLFDLDEHVVAIQNLTCREKNEDVIVLFGR